MATIKITLDHTLKDGESVTFKAPCDCTAVTGITVTYPTRNETGIGTAEQTFVFCDAHGTELTELGNLFTTGTYVSAILNTTDGCAFLKNADTNSYLENTFVKPVVETKELEIRYGNDSFSSSITISCDATLYTMGNLFMLDTGVLALEYTSGFGQLGIKVSDFPANGTVLGCSVIGAGESKLVDMRTRSVSSIIYNSAWVTPASGTACERRVVFFGLLL